MTLDQVVIYPGVNQSTANKIVDVLMQNGIQANLTPGLNWRFFNTWGYNPDSNRYLHWNVVVAKQQAIEAKRIVAEFIAAEAAMHPLSDEELEKQALAPADPHEDP